MTVTATAEHTTVVTGPDEPGKEVNKDQWNGTGAHSVVITGLGSAAEAATTDFDAAGAATAAVAAHVAAGDPHPQYLTAAEGNAAYEASGAVATHAAAADPHTGYQKESEKDAANGYAGLSAGTKLSGTQQTYGSIANTACEGNDARLSDSRAPNGSASGDLAGTYPSPTVTQARGLRETTGPTTLALGAVADGEFLRRVGATVVGAAPGAGSFSASQATVTLPYASRSHSVVVTDANVTAASKILLSLAGVAETEANSSDSVEVLSMQAVPAAGSFTFQPTFLTPVGGPLKINYAVG
jgi:hypothetical protein